jgi:hypothetical protein
MLALALAWLVLLAIVVRRVPLVLELWLVTTAMVAVLRRRQAGALDGSLSGSDASVGVLPQPVLTTGAGSGPQVGDASASNAPSGVIPAVDTTEHARTQLPPTRTTSDGGAGCPDWGSPSP